MLLLARALPSLWGGSHPILDIEDRRRHGRRTTRGASILSQTVDANDKASQAAAPALRAPFAWEKNYPASIAWNAPIPSGTIPALFARAVADYETRSAIEFRDRSISFGDLGRAAERMASAFLSHGLKPQDAIAIYLPNTPLHPIAFFGALKAGGKVV